VRHENIYPVRRSPGLRSDAASAGRTTATAESLLRLDRESDMIAFTASWMMISSNVCREMR